MTGQEEFLSKSLKTPRKYYICYLKHTDLQLLVSAVCIFVVHVERCHDMATRSTSLSFNFIR